MCNIKTTQQESYKPSGIENLLELITLPYVLVIRMSGKGIPKETQQNPIKQLRQKFSCA
jgi:hypothetical protein